MICSDDTLCDAPQRVAAMPALGSVYDKSCNVNSVCAADATCKLNLSVGYLPDPETGRLLMILSALFVPSAGALNPETFDWAVNGTPLPETTQVISIDTSILVDGDVITVSAKDSADCEKLIEYVVTDLQQNCSTLICQIDSTDYLDGDVVNLGNVAQSASEVVRVNYLTATGDINVSAVAVTGDASTSSTSPTPPTTLVSSGGDMSVDVTLDTTTLGAQSVTVAVTHDGCDGLHEITLNFTVV
jgi:hypothetical protein